MIPPSEQELDLRAAHSPLLYLKVRQALCRLKPGQTLTVWLGAPHYVCDLERIITTAGDRLLDSRLLPQGWRVVLGRNPGGGSGPPAGCGGGSCSSGR